MLNSTSKIISSIPPFSTANNSLSTPPIDGVDYQTGWIVFWCSAALCMIAGVISILGNGLVLYVSCLNNDTGRFRYVNWVSEYSMEKRGAMENERCILIFFYISMCRLLSFLPNCCITIKHC